MVDKKPFVLRKRRINPRSSVASRGISIPQLTMLGKEVNKKVTEIMANSVVFYLKQEAIKAVAKGAPSFLRSASFLSALDYEIVKESRGKYSFKLTLKYDEKWSFLSAYLESTGKPYKMRWLTRSEMKKNAKIPIKDKKTGDLVFRSVPLTTKNAWVHPGVKKFTWIDKGVRKGIDRAMPEVMRYINAEINKRALGKK